MFAVMVGRIRIEVQSFESETVLNGVLLPLSRSIPSCPAAKNCVALFFFFQRESMEIISLLFARSRFRRCCFDTWWDLFEREAVRKSPPHFIANWIFPT